MGLIDPKSPQGATAWDYGNALVHELKQLRQDIQEGHGKDGKLKRLPFSITTDVNGIGNAVLPIPMGKIWAPKAAFAIGTATMTSVITLYLGSTDSAMTGLAAIPSVGNARYQFVFNSDELIYPEDQKVIVDHVAPAGGAIAIITGNLRVIEFDASQFETLNAN